IERVSKDFPLQEGTTGWTGRQESFCVFREVDLRLDRGEFLTLIGHSGCGKSTLLNIIAGFEQASTGGVILDGKEVTAPGLDRMVVFQSFALMPWMTAFDNVRLAVRAAHPRWDKTQVREETQRYLDLMGLKGAEYKRPAFLSGGMRQRIGLEPIPIGCPDGILLADLRCHRRVGHEYRSRDHSSRLAYT
ncbi:MAG TPA: ATP-binding cassette domain-containing protein, partial [Candidatus Tectomicrobia bacterium]